MQNCLQEIDTDLWARAMLQESEAPPLFYDDIFQSEAAAVLHNDLHMRHTDITFGNCKTVYIHLVNAMA